MPKEKIKWIGNCPPRCDVCWEPFKDFFYQVRCKGNGWGTFSLCNKCFELEGCELGLGKGQKYDLITLEKIEG